MKYYKDNQNNVYAYESDGSQDHLIGDKVALTAEEVEAHINPPIVIVIPKVVTKLQLMEAMLETDVTATSNMWLDFKAIKATNELLSDYWDSTQEVNRNHPMTLGMIPLMNKTEADLDALFLLASTK